ncbi:hypothetical protein HD842_003722 [Massilia aurea]|jgi:hypothetical protein|uniref:Uncharacterized protein n=1 Tax=Massilia aurea TaxID=373040 RepID=A0A7W9X302_9BURK|nr:hypothetical protein [Massilia aurea]MBB6135555.1 hypothetical protein [Massilia aurea]
MALFDATRAFFIRHARLVAVVQLTSALALGGGSVWYGAWYQDAQGELHDELKKSNAKTPKPNFWAVSKAGLNWASPVPYTAFGLIFGLISGAGVFITAARVEKLEADAASNEVARQTFARDLENEQEDHAETQKYYYDALHEHLKRYCCSEIPNFDDSCRASIYRYDGESGVMRMVFRHCATSRYNSKGRVTIPANEGIIGAVLQNGDDAFINKLPMKTSVPKYSKAANKVLGNYGTSIHENTLQRLRMPSRCYYAFALRNISDGSKFAVIVLESTNESHFDPDQIKPVLGSHAHHAAQYVRHIIRLDTVLNPYGVS